MTKDLSSLYLIYFRMFEKFSFSFKYDERANILKSTGDLKFQTYLLPCDFLNSLNYDFIMESECSDFFKRISDISTFNRSGK